MKRFMTLLLLTLSLHAVPAYLQEEICTELAHHDTHCGDGSDISYYKHFLMDDDKVLLFLYLNSHSLPDEEFLETFPKVAVVIDKDGQWHLSKSNYYKWEYYISDIREDFKHQLWIRAYMGMESPTPLLLYSKNGQKWYDVNWPREKNRSSFEYEIERLCFQKNHLILGLAPNWDSKIQFWRTAYTSITDKEPKWKQLASEYRTEACIERPKIKNRWSVEREKDGIHFRLNKINFIVPVAETKGLLYTIQLGAFKKEESLNVVYKKFDSLLDFYPLLKDDGKAYLRLFSGLFTSKKKAQIVLEKLKKKYPKNSTLQDAFIATMDRM